jgi:negative regulator of flagellin synthesis FlgM
MSSINNIGQNMPIPQVANPVTPPIQKQVPASAPNQVRVTDKVELSGVSHILAALKKNDIRADKVAQVKAQIAAGTYEDDKKLDAASDRLLDDLLK